MRWWPRQPAAARDARRAETDGWSVERQRATVIAHGRLMRQMQQDETVRDPGDLAAASVDACAYVCGVGRVPVPVLIAAADLDDARVNHREHPDDPDAADAHALAAAALAAAVAAASPGTRGNLPA